MAYPCAQSPRLKLICNVAKLFESDLALIAVFRSELTARSRYMAASEPTAGLSGGMIKVDEESYGSVGSNA